MCIDGKETICWGCQNYSRCSWSRGKPVKGWKAIPTKLVDNLGGGDTRIIHSYLVESCPHFKADKKRRVLVVDIAQIIGVKERQIYRIIKANGVKKVGEMLKAKGYKLHVCEEEGEKHSYYVEKI